MSDPQRETTASAFWLVLTAGATILSINIGIRQSLGLFQAPMWTGLGISSTEFGLVIGINNLMWGVAAIWAAQAAERFGVARTVAAGGLLYALGMAAMALGGHLELFGFPAVFGVAVGLVVGLAVAACGIPLVLGVIARRAPEAKRVRYMAIASAGGSFGQFILPPYTQWGIESFAWSGGALSLATLALVIIGLALALREKPGAVVPAQAWDETTIRMAVGHRDYRCLNLGFFVCGFHVALIATHMDAYLVTCGLPQGTGAIALAIIGLMNIVGTLIAGMAGDHYRKTNLLAMIYFGRAVAIVVFMVAPKTEAVVMVFAAVMGALWLATVPLTSGVVAQKYGAGRVPKLFGFVMLSHQIGAFLGAFLSGLIFDLTGGFEGAWWIGVALGVIAALVNLPIDERRAERLNPA